MKDSDAALPPLALILRAELERRGWTVADLARAAGLSHDAVWFYTRGEREPKLEQARRLAAGLGRSLAWLERKIVAIEQRSKA